MSNVNYDPQNGSRTAPQEEDPGKKEDHDETQGREGVYEHVDGGQHGNDGGVDEEVLNANLVEDAQGFLQRDELPAVLKGSGAAVSGAGVYGEICREDYSDYQELPSPGPVGHQDPVPARFHSVLGTLPGNLTMTRSCRPGSLPLPGAHPRSKGCS